jgi:hypothetical protein
MCSGPISNALHFERLDLYLSAIDGHQSELNTKDYSKSTSSMLLWLEKCNQEIWRHFYTLKVLTHYIGM